MPDIANDINIKMRDDGYFVVSTNTGNSITYKSDELILALEEVVFQFRGKRPSLTTKQPYTPPKQVPKVSNDILDQAATKVSTTKTKVTEPGEEYYNGGLGPRIGSVKNDGFGL